MQKLVLLLSILATKFDLNFRGSSMKSFFLYGVLVLRKKLATRSYTLLPTRQNLLELKRFLKTELDYRIFLSSLQALFISESELQSELLVILKSNIEWTGEGRQTAYQVSWSKTDQVAKTGLENTNDS